MLGSSGRKADRGTANPKELWEGQGLPRLPREDQGPQRFGERGARRRVRVAAQGPPARELGARGASLPSSRARVGGSPLVSAQLQGWDSLVGEAVLRWPAHPWPKLSDERPRRRRASPGALLFRRAA